MNINFTLVMQAIAFAAFIWFTARFIWPPLMGAIETRQKQIADGLAAGEAGKQSLASAEKRIGDMMAEAKTRSSEIVAQGVLHGTPGGSDPAPHLARVHPAVARAEDVDGSRRRP